MTRQEGELCGRREEGVGFEEVVAEAAGQGRRSLKEQGLQLAGSIPPLALGSPPKVGWGCTAILLFNFQWLPMTHPQSPKRCIVGTQGSHAWPSQQPNLPQACAAL
jgi:hypothetical protein